MALSRIIIKIFSLLATDYRYYFVSVWHRAETINFSRRTIFRFDRLDEDPGSMNMNDYLRGSMKKPRQKSMKGYTKYTSGYVAQKYVRHGRKFVCVSQNYISWDEISYENDSGDPIKIEQSKEVPFPIKLVQPISETKQR